MYTQIENEIILHSIVVLLQRSNNQNHVSKPASTPINNTVRSYSPRPNLMKYFSVSHKNNLAASIHFVRLISSYSLDFQFCKPESFLFNKHYYAMLT
jgi:hypothetical protein